ncbi:MAG: methanogenesis marker 9 domain-containing protein [Candidatus Hermodarchaeota archaeon]
MVTLDQDKLRQLPGWKDAPIHICMDADYRGLTFCCKPGYSLTFAYKCKRDEVLKKLGITPERFIKIKEDFSRENNWDSELVCFGSLSYCCMRRGGCERRDPALRLRYPDKTKDEIMEIYYTKKKELAIRILKATNNHEEKQEIETLIQML